MMASPNLLLTEFVAANNNLSAHAVKMLNIVYGHLKAVGMATIDKVNRDILSHSIC